MYFLKKLKFWQRTKRLAQDDVEWVVNDLSELGVKIGDKFFFLYKGYSYKGGSKWRPVFKREFGECCHPWTAIELREYGDIQRGRDRVRLPETYVGFHGEGADEWKPLPNGDA